MLLRSYVGGMVAVGGMAFIYSPVILIILRLFQGIFSGTLSAAQTLISTSTPDEHSGFALGALNSAMFSGTLTGALWAHHFSLISKEKLPFITIQSFLSLFSVLF